MIKKISMLLLACVLMVSSGFAANKSDTTKSTTTKSATMKSDMTKVSGTVEKIDFKTHTLTLNTGSETKSFTIGSKTAYVHEGKKVKSTNLKVGDKVDLWANSKNMAHKIDIEVANATTTH